MSFVKVAFMKLGKVLLAIVSVIKRMFCCIRRRRRNSDVPLPLTADVKLISAPLQHFTNNENATVHNWSSWDDDELPSSIKIIDNINRDTLESQNNQSYQSVGRAYNRQPSNEPELEIDYFQDMVPEISKSKTLVIKNCEEMVPQISNDSLSKRLAVEPQITPLITTELQQWVDNEESWEDSLGSDILLDVDAALKESKQLEREKKAAENQRRKQEKEAMRVSKKEHLFTKLS